jgi:hypothetical protein
MPVILNLFQDNAPPLVVLKQVQDDERMEFGECCAKALM